MRILLIAVFFALAGCGVKGDPVPPEEPAYIGRGKPSFKKGVSRFDVRTEPLEEEKESVEEEQEEEE